MSPETAQFLEQFRKLPPTERREVCELILRETLQPNHASPRKTIADIAGKYRPGPDKVAKPHDQWFAEAIHISKGPAPAR